MELEVCMASSRNSRVVRWPFSEFIELRARCPVGSAATAAVAATGAIARGAGN